MERSTTVKAIETISRKEQLSPEMAFVAIINASTAVPEDELAWQQKGACTMANADGFYPGKGESINDAKKVCANCKVRDICLEYALDHNEEHGVWGGLSVRERRKELQQRQQHDVAA